MLKLDHFKKQYQEIDDASEKENNLINNIKAREYCRLSHDVQVVTLKFASNALDYMLYRLNYRKEYIKKKEDETSSLHD